MERKETAGFDVLKECVIEGEYYQPGDYYESSPWMSKKALYALIGRGFIRMVHIFEKKLTLPRNVYDLLRDWMNLNRPKLTSFSVLALRPDGDGCYYIFYGYADQDNRARILDIRTTTRLPFDEQDRELKYKLSDFEAK